MAESLTVARPYAKALYEVAADESSQDWLSVMQVCEALGQDDDTKRFLNAHDLTVERFDAVMKKLFSSAGVSTVPPKFTDFIRVLSKNKRFALLPDVATLFIEELNKSNETVVADIVSAKPLAEKSQTALIKKLEKRFGKKVETNIKIDESLIGGAVIKVGDTVIDGSVKGRLEQLTKVLN